MSGLHKLWTTTKICIGPVLLLLCGISIWDRAIASGFGPSAILQVSLVTFIFAVMAMAGIMALCEMKGAAQVWAITKMGIGPMLFLLCGIWIWDNAIASGFNRLAILQVSLMTFILVVVALVGIMALFEMKEDAARS